MLEEVEETVAAWARSGAMALTGPPDGPGLGPPAPLVPRLREVADVLRARSEELGTPVDVDPLTLLTERSAIVDLRRQGQVSCGGAARLLPAADGWVAVSLARPDDVDLVPAWTSAEVPVAADPWPAVAAHAATRPRAELVEQATELGLPVADLPDELPPAPTMPVPLAPLPCRAERVADGPRTDGLDGVVVVDLGSLWAGPLCGSLLADAGATVIKLESTSRPDGARLGPPAFFDLVNAGKRSVALDLADRDGRRAVSALLARADVVIEASRPRALEQLGADAAELLRTARPRVWVSLTGHGRTPDQRLRVGFGDDAAVGGGLVAWDGDRPSFCADAVADPASGLVAAAAVLDALSAGGRWLLDVALSGVAAHLAGPTLAVPEGIVAAEPTAPRHRGEGPALGADTDAVLADLGLG